MKFNVLISQMLDSDAITKLRTCMNDAKVYTSATSGTVHKYIELLKDKEIILLQMKTRLRQFEGKRRH